MGAETRSGQAPLLFKGTYSRISKRNLTILLLEEAEDRQSLVAEPTIPCPNKTTNLKALARKSYCKYCIAKNGNATRKRKLLAEMPNKAIKRPGPFYSRSGRRATVKGLPL